MTNAPDPRRIADILLASPTWARLGLACPDQRAREQAAETLGAILVDRLSRPAIEIDPRQTALPL